MRFGAETAVNGRSGSSQPRVGESATRAEVGSRKLRILVVEDDPAMLAVTLDLLRILGHWASGVQSAEGALIRYLDGAFDVLLTDVGLPALSGRDLAEKLRGRHDLPVIFATGYPAPGQLPPRTAWLRKPYTVEQLDDALRRMVTRPPPDREQE